MSIAENSESLEKLLSRVALGDRSAFRELYVETSPDLFGSLKRLLKDNALAEDALQEAYVQIWGKADFYRAGEVKPMTWLHSIARYRAIDIMRRRSKDKQSISVERDAIQSDPALVYFDRLPEGGDRLLKHCLSRMDQSQRDLIIQCYCEGYSHSELSEKLNTPLGTIKSWIRRGLKSLRECMDI